MCNVPSTYLPSYITLSSGSSVFGLITVKGGWGKQDWVAAAAAVVSVMSDSVRPQRQQPTRLPCPWDSRGKNTGVGCHFLLECMKVKSENEVAQLCPTRSDPMDCSPPGSSIHGMFQSRALGVPLSINCPTHLFMFSHSLCGCKHDKDVGSQSSRLLI